MIISRSRIDLENYLLDTFWRDLDTSKKTQHTFGVFCQVVTKSLMSTGKCTFIPVRQFERDHQEVIRGTEGGEMRITHTFQDPYSFSSSSFVPSKARRCSMLNEEKDETEKKRAEVSRRK